MPLLLFALIPCPNYYQVPHYNYTSRVLHVSAFSYKALNNLVLFSRVGGSASHINIYIYIYERLYINIYLHIYTYIYICTYILREPYVRQL